LPSAAAVCSASRQGAVSCSSRRAMAERTPSGMLISTASSRNHALPRR
jgi:hypothetical protein